jgi:bifunctional aspartate aminotransferase and glutamate/aspartate-prephenate aminotransferase
MSIQANLKATSSFKPRLSPMVQNMEVSKTIEIHAMTKEMEKNGMTVFSLCVGEPDYQPPPQVIQATVSAQ